MAGVLGMLLKTCVDLFVSIRDMIRDNKKKKSDE